MPKDSKLSLQNLQSISKWKIFLPAIIGIGVVAYLFWKNVDVQELSKIKWNANTVFWVSLALVLYSVRHLAYSLRIKVLSDDFFSWKKSIELIFLWEFASAISPTALGGSATALILLSQERYPGAKAVAIILYSVVLDTLFFLITLPILFIILGPIIIRPEMSSALDVQGYGITFWAVYGLMFLYGMFFFYGLFINPKQLQRILYAISKIPFLKRFKDNLRKVGDDIIIASKELKQKNARFHIIAILTTMLAWSIRFAIIPILIFAFIQTKTYGFYDFVLLWTRNETMFAITAFSPTPGGSGVAEALFGGFFRDYIPKNNAVVIALIWRIITYYSYLFIGMIVLPNWINNILHQRKIRNNNQNVD